MTAEQLRAQPTRPVGVGDEVVALWQDAQGDWEGAHATVQDLETPAAAWVHAYLHRREGDQSNARYWYARAAKPACRLPLDEEWAAIASSLLEGASHVGPSA
jgi:hypothetical protein